MMSVIGPVHAVPLSWGSRHGFAKLWVLFAGPPYGPRHTCWLPLQRQSVRRLFSILWLYLKKQDNYGTLERYIEVGWHHWFC